MKTNYSIDLSYNTSIIEENDPSSKLWWVGLILVMIMIICVCGLPGRK